MTCKASLLLVTEHTHSTHNCRDCLKKTDLFRHFLETKEGKIRTCFCTFRKPNNGTSRACAGCDEIRTAETADNVVNASACRLLLVETSTFPDLTASRFSHTPPSPSPAACTHNKHPDLSRNNCRLHLLPNMLWLPSPQEKLFLSADDAHASLVAMADAIAPPPQSQTEATAYKRTRRARERERALQRVSLWRGPGK
jgi:hypothetical protein